MFKLYHAATSVCSIKVRIGLAEIGGVYEEVELDLQAGDQHDPAYLELNPAGVVPTLIDDGLVLVESSLILEYLDREYNDGRLMPKGRAAEAAARHWLLRCLAIHGAINTLSFSTVMRDRAMASRTPAQIAADLDAMPDPVARAKRRDLYDHGLGSMHVGAALRTMDRTFRDMVAALEKTRWVSGDGFGVTDIALVPYIDRLWRLGFEALWAGRHDGIADWLRAMQDRPSYQAEVAGRIPAEQAVRMREGGSKHIDALLERVPARG
ncbi:glutathione S-transferase family protein [Wenxinia marina]|uniref:Glutathione S-transferase n=1 Tax=Wenxinia marina DSM 24838 TaxID=1123501 RepID=A0A0D0Q368_9RHOB|nr:glutathione S-transferase family protein [Wenxinia marina]KIQ68999.1 Glutathione S-transferase [Wenxinia marina DSM 24838]GGL81010.1 hypothetical protein GCM10011392_39510 [Wenxinia marina]